MTRTYRTRDRFGLSRPGLAGFLPGLTESGALVRRPRPGRCGRIGESPDRTRRSYSGGITACSA